jgi:hypothetical protein
VRHAGKFILRRVWQKTTRWLFAAGLVLLASAGTSSVGVLRAPSDSAAWPEWREYLHKWREETRSKISYDDTLYCRREFSWVPACYSVCFLMVYDQMFYDGKTGCYRVEEFLDHGEREFGGYDGVVLWHAYPRIGFDERNQFDFYRDLPGGLQALREVSRRFHDRGVRVFIDYNPWDRGTRREGASDADALVELVKAVDADGIFLDTLSSGPEEFREKLNGARPGVVLESELALPAECVATHHMSWAQWFEDSEAPGVLANKWLERRHMMHQIRRWSRDHTGELHIAWMNGTGMLVWENVFGSRVGWNARDRSILRAMLPIQRRYVSLFSGEKWTPLVRTEKKEVYASLWEGGGLRLWTFVNRSERPAQGRLLEVDHKPGSRYFDLIAGVEIHPTIMGGTVTLEGLIRPRGIGAFVSGPVEALARDFSEFLLRQKDLDKRADFDTSFPALGESLRPVRPTKKYVKRRIPPTMLAMPASTFDMTVRFRVRECGFYETEPPVNPAASLHRLQSRTRKASVGAYAIDVRPVTNQEFALFLNASGYEPRYSENFLKHWQEGKPLAGKEDAPVVYVDLGDARAYAEWAGKRLPREEEWQLALETGRAGWGSERVWEWTESERTDGRTRFCILKGGSDYKASGSDWYADGGPQTPDFAAKFLLMWPGLDRCRTIGFRCAVDLEESGEDSGPAKR